MDIKRFNLSSYVDRVHNGDEKALIELCGEVTSALQEFGVILVEDARFGENLNRDFVSRMQTFFSNIGGVQQHDLVEQGKGVFDVQKRLTKEELDTMPREYHPNMAIDDEELAMNFHYSWKMGPRTPRKEPEPFATTVRSMANTMLETVNVLTEMIGIGLGLPKDTFTSLIDMAPHVLAPNGCNLGIFGNKGTVLAPYHYDSNFLTIQGRSRFNGLYVWLNNGRKVEVSIPAGYLLVHTGKQIEWLTGGNFKAVMQEVIVTDRTIEALTIAKEQDCSLWGISSTLYVQIAQDAILKPLETFVGSQLAENYPPTRAGDLVAGIDD